MKTVRYLSLVLTVSYADAASPNDMPAGSGYLSGIFNLFRSSGASANLEAKTSEVKDSPDVAQAVCAEPLRTSPDALSVKSADDDSDDDWILFGEPELKPPYPSLTNAADEVPFSPPPEEAVPGILEQLTPVSSDEAGSLSANDPSERGKPGSDSDSSSGSNVEQKLGGSSTPEFPGNTVRPPLSGDGGHDMDEDDAVVIENRVLEPGFKPNPRPEIKFTDPDAGRVPEPIEEYVPAERGVDEIQGDDVFFEIVPPVTDAPQLQKVYTYLPYGQDEIHHARSAFLNRRTNDPFFNRIKDNIRLDAFPGCVSSVPFYIGSLNCSAFFVKFHDSLIGNHRTIRVYAVDKAVTEKDFCSEIVKAGVTLETLADRLESESSPFTSGSDAWNRFTGATLPLPKRLGKKVIQVPYPLLYKQTAETLLAERIQVVFAIQRSDKIHRETKGKKKKYVRKVS